MRNHEFRKQIPSENNLTLLAALLLAPLTALHAAD